MPISETKCTLDYGVTGAWRGRGTGTHTAARSESSSAGDSVCASRAKITRK